MKQYFKYITTMVALLTMTVGTWADDDRVNITILPETQAAAPGTVVPAIEGNTCMLTVTPTNGYYATVENISVKLTVDGNLAQAPRHAPNINNNVVVTALTPFADPCGVTRYAFFFPDDTYNAEVTVEFQPIALRVGGVAVTPTNRANITGDNITGTVSYTPAIPATDETPAIPAKLTLNGATIDMTQDNGYPIESSIENLTVLLIGNNTLKVNAEKASGFSYSNAANAGTLTFAHTEFPGVNGFGKLTVTGGTIASGYTIDNDFPESQTVPGWRQTGGENPTITYVEYYNLYIGSTHMKSDELSILGGQVSYYPVTQTLSLNNFTTTDNIQTSLSNLVVAVTGVNSVNKISFTGTSANGNTITIRKASSSTEEVNKLTANLENYDNNNITVEEPLHAIQPYIFSDVVNYALYINGTGVNSENKNDILKDGKVSFNAKTNTLTLDDVTIDNLKTNFITNGLDKLTINLVGENTIDCGNFNFLVKKEGDNDHDVAFTTSLNEAGKLIVTLPEANDWFTGHKTPTYLNNLTFNSSVTEGTMTITVAAPKTTYDLTIGGHAVTNLNASKVLGDDKVSFDANENILTLNAATIEGDITSGIETLVVILKGVNTMSGKFVNSGSGNKVVFTTTDINGKLTMGGAIEGLTAEFRYQLELNDNVIALPADYGITVNETLVTPGNRDDVLGDNTVWFDGNNTLTLENASVTSITVAQENKLPDNTLMIRLMGSNTITNDGNAVAYDNGGSDKKMKLTFITPEEAGSTLVYTNTNEAPTAETTFRNFDVEYKNNLTSTIDNSKKTLTIAIPLLPVVTAENPVSRTIFSEELNSTSQTNNDNINGGLLVTMNEDKNDPTNTGGYNQITNQLEFTENSAMSQNQVDNVNAQPGTEQYATQFTGITGFLEAGEYILEMFGIELTSDEMYDFFVKIGNQDPIGIRDIIEKIGGENVAKIEALLAEPAFFQIYLGKPENGGGAGAPAMKPGHRIGPKASVTGALGGLKVTNNNMQTSEPPAMTYKAMEMSAVAAGMSAIGNALNGYTCSDPDITDLPDNMFVDNTLSPAPRRAGGVKTILPEGLTFVDFSNTKITGMEVSRESGAFNAVPDNVFIYMPAGNSVAAGTKNVVIGSISENVELNGSIDALPFKALKDFKAGQITLKRTFEAGGNDKKATIYLPYDIPQEEANKLGTFYEYKGNNGTIVSMDQVEAGGLKANKPYIFQAKEGGITDPTVRVVDVKANPAETEGFKGVFERKDYEDGMYCYAGENRGGYTIGQFVPMGPGSYVPPFRAYMIGDGAPSYAIAWDGIVDEFDDVTDVKTIETKKTVANEKTSEGWWTMSGMRMTEMPKKAGLYIFNGKMVVVKN